MLAAFAFGVFGYLACGSARLRHAIHEPWYSWCGMAAVSVLCWCISGLAVLGMLLQL